MAKVLFLSALILASGAACAQAPKSADVLPVEAHAHTAERSCLFADKRYTEGAIYRIDDYTLICVERDWGNMIAGFEAKRNAANPLVWEPITSKRIEARNMVTGMNKPAKRKP